MDCVDFFPNEDYRILIQQSNIRKNELDLNNLNYRRLQKENLYQKFGYELHHIVPRYRMKGLPLSQVNHCDNIAILTSREHLLAHLYLTQFESEQFLSSSQVALIHLWSLNSAKDILKLTPKELENLLPLIEKSRKEYFNSDKHKRGASLAGKIAGEKRRKRFKEDGEFRNYILGKLKISPEKQKQISQSKIEKNKKLPPWCIQSRSGTVDKYYKYKEQYWHIFDSIYEGVLKYKLSYTLIAKILDVDHKRISNIVRIIHSRLSDSDPEFENYEFYKDFQDKYNLTYLNNRIKFENYIENKIKKTPVGITRQGESFVVRVKDLMVVLQSGRFRSITKSFNINSLGEELALKLAKLELEKLKLRYEKHS